LLGLLVFASMVGVVAGLLMCLSGAKRYLGKKVALTSVASFAALMSIAVARGPSTSATASPTEVRASTPTQAVANITQTYVEPKPENLSKSQILANFRIRAFSWEKDGFGSIMMARFILHNDNPMPLKDIEVTCSSSGPSGSIIDTNSRTVFDVVRQKSFLEVDKINMGFIRSEAVETKCRVTNFSKT
jgi:hypothetical protein